MDSYRTALTGEKKKTVYAERESRTRRVVMEAMKREIVELKDERDELRKRLVHRCEKWKLLNKTPRAGNCWARAHNSIALSFTPLCMIL